MSTVLIPSTLSLRHRITAASITALGAGAIAFGAMVLTAPAADAKTFKQSCIEDPHLYHSEGVRGQHSVEYLGASLHEVCRVYNAAFNLVITADQPFRKANPKQPDPVPTAPRA